jgi:hypothetical protein
VLARYKRSRDGICRLSRESIRHLAFCDGFRGCLLLLSPRGRETKQMERRAKSGEDFAVLR